MPSEIGIMRAHSPGRPAAPSHCHTEFTVPPRTPHHVAVAVLANIVRHRGNFSTVIGRPRFGHIWRRIGGSVVTGSAIDVGSLGWIGNTVPACTTTGTRRP